MNDQLTMDKLVAAYVQLRDKKKGLDEAHKEAMRPVNDKLEWLENRMQRSLLDSGVRSAKTGNGTAYLQERVSAVVEDWDEVLGYVQQHSAWDLLERRVAKTAFEDRLKAGDAIPGVRRTVDLKTNVRRA